MVALEQGVHVHHIAGVAGGLVVCVLAEVGQKLVAVPQMCRGMDGLSVRSQLWLAQIDRLTRSRCWVAR